MLEVRPGCLVHRSLLSTRGWYQGHTLYGIYDEEKDPDDDDDDGDDDEEEKEEEVVSLMESRITRRGTYLSR